jgi:asparagine synthase (glutamine-hydrolysing)
MCGIAGIFAYGNAGAPVDPVELRTIRDAMESRGPDGKGAWISPDGRVGVGQGRLSFVDLRHLADPPLAADNGRLQIVFNGEIYNYQDLRRELVAEGRELTTESDTEVVLHLYDRDGPAMLSRLRGMFAIAIWDERSRTLFLARDQFGIKPLYYANDGKTFRFASQVKALLAGGQIDLAPDPAGHVGFFLWGHVPDPHTLYRAVRALPAGTWMTVDAKGAAAPRAFFDLAALFAAAGPAPATPEARRALLRAALADSVTHHLIADVPVGVFLSAGLDSSTICALAAEEGPAEEGAGNLRTVTLGFREFAGTENDETGLAEAVAQQRGTRHQTRWVLGKDFANERERLLAAMDQPSIDGVNTYFVAKATRESGLKAALSGLGGDELFAGYPSFRQVPKLAETLGPLGLVPALGRAVRHATAPWIGSFTSPKYAGVVEYGTNFAGAYLLRRALFMPWELARMMPAAFLRDGLDALDLARRLESSAQGFATPRLKVSALELQWYMRHQLLRDADWAGMAHSVEIRVPFVDVTLVERLAPLLASDAPPTKRDMAATPRVPLPDAVLNRAKTGFVVPVRDWIAGESNFAGERGLRGWAKLVYGASPGTDCGIALARSA